MGEDRKTVVYFIPHQDDELLTFGVNICKTVKYCRVVVVLFTDGSNSYVKSVLSNRHKCNKHLGKHTYNLTNDEFVLARDNEFIDSCMKLGIGRENIIIPSYRVKDGSLSVEAARKIIEEFFSENGMNISMVCSIQPLNNESQHHDHVNLGTAVIQMSKKYNIDIKTFVEPYCINSVGDEEIVCLAEKPSLIEHVKLASALHSYKVWKPARARYAVGYHSVTTEFDDFNIKPRSFCYVKQQ